MGEYRAHVMWNGPCDQTPQAGGEVEGWEGRKKTTPAEQSLVNNGRQVLRSSWGWITFGRVVSYSERN